MSYNWSRWQLFDAVIKETGLEHEVIENEVRNGNIFHSKYEILSTVIDPRALIKAVDKYNGRRLERDWGKGIYCFVSELNATIELDDGVCYLTISFTDTIGEKD